MPLGITALLFAMFLSPSWAAKAQGIENEIVDWSNPVERCWSVSATPNTGNGFASDNEEMIFSSLFLDHGVSTLSSDFGSVLWNAKFGSLVVKDLKISSDRLFVLTQSTVDSDENVQNQRRIPHINAIDILSGINTWTTPLPSLNHDIVNPLIGVGTTSIYITENNGELISIDKRDGGILWKTETGALASSAPLETKTQVAIGGGDKSLRLFSKSSGKLEKEIALGFVPTVLIGYKNDLLIGGMDGRVVRLNSRHKTKWSVTTGGEITELFVIDRAILVVSKDNYIYRLSAKRGNKKWKRMLSGRVLGGTLLGSMTGIFISTGSNEAIIIELRKGKILNRVRIESDNYFIAPPINTSIGFALATDKGIAAYSTNCIAGAMSLPSSSKRIQSK